MLENLNDKNNGKVQINGDEYLTVAYRLAAFRAKYPIELGWSIETECIYCDDQKVIFKAAIKMPEGKVVATGHAQEKSSDYENCETSAIGRVLAGAGFIGEFAIADKVALAIQEVKPQTSQVALSEQAKPAPEKAQAKPTSKDAEPNQAKQDEQGEQAEQSQAAPVENVAERWAKDHLIEWLDMPCQFAKAQGRTWREIAENKGEKINVKGKPCLPRAYLHALESWDQCSMWQRMKARVALDVVKNGNGKH